MRNYEISIEVPQHRLRALGLTLQDISNVIRAGAVTLSVGSIETQEAEVRVRTVGQRYDQKDFEDMVVLARGDGTIVRLGDIAEVRDDFEQSALVVRHQGQPAAFIEVSRAQGEDVADVVATVKEYVEDTLSPSLPEGVRITVWNDDSELFAERLNLLITNGGKILSGCSRRATTGTGSWGPRPGGTDAVSGTASGDLNPGWPLG